MSVVLGPLAVDAADPVALRAFWAGVLGVHQQRRLLDVRPQKGPKSVKNRVHLDVRVGDPDRLIALGARLLAAHPPDWVTLADVEGNEFCAFPDPALPADEPAEAFAVCTDSDRPEDLAAWWAPLVGARVDDGPDGTPRWLRGCAGWEGLIWKFVRVDDVRVVPNRWRPTVTGAGHLLVAGAIEDGPDQLVDPQGNEVSVARPATSEG
ncbi:VOC family protein [Mycobacterium sp. NPDC050041]|uniref:VOC family protein n=1 Tax=Mycobacterium sp. NPDC050041 TaxID=3364293 RepID=UPI003C2ED7AF